MIMHLDQRSNINESKGWDDCSRNIKKIFSTNWNTAHTSSARIAHQEIMFSVK
ncbi:7244_t:CDS:2 [Entrophospora sp. SA101]|nr:7244_t:CDS:2 [Entrophospora sp. SA101]